MLENNKNLPILLDGQIILYPWYNIQNKINLYTLTIFNNFYFFCHCIPCIGHNILFSELFELFIKQCWILFYFFTKYSFILQSQCCHPVNICSFISFSFVKMLLQVTHAFNYSSVFSEVFLYHVITWTKYQNVLIFSSHYFMK